MDILQIENILIFLTYEAGWGEAGEIKCEGGGGGRIKVIFFGGGGGGNVF